MSFAITGIGTQVYLGTPVGEEPIVYTLLGELASFEPIGREWDVNDVTNFQSGMTKEKIKGLKNPGQYNLIGNRIFDDASQILLQAAFNDPNPYWFQVVFPINPYTGSGEIWTFAALVLSIDPPKVAPNKALQFFSKLQATGARQTSNGYNNATGFAAKFHSATLGGYTFGVGWSDFKLSPLRQLPQDAVIQGIYPVIIASGTYDICFQYIGNGPGSGISFSHPYGTHPILPGASFASTMFWGCGSGGDSIGTSLSLLAGESIGMAINSSLLDFATTDEIAASGVGYAIYYTSSSPNIDPQMPPPFAVPAGQGLAWALPFTVSLEIDAGNGTASGTAATLNSV